MNILYIYRSLTAFGGVERIFTDKANYLAEQLGHTVYIVTFEQGTHPIVYPLSPKVTHIDLDVHFYEQYRHGKLKRLQMQMEMEKRFLSRLTELIERIKADIVICATCEFTVMKIVSMLKGSEKTVIETHGAKAYIEKGNIKEANRLTRLAFKLKDRMLYNYIKKANAFVTLTEDDAKDWMPIKSAYTIPNMITFYPLKVNTEKTTQKRVISAGRLTEQKGYDLLLQAWEIVNHYHPDWKLDIYGAGEDEIMLLNEVEKRQLHQSISIHPPTNNIYEKYMESDIYVMSSRWEGFGLVLSEAMSCSIPCVSFNCPHGPSSIIRDGEDGLLVENGNTTQLAAKIRYLIEHEEIRKEMGRKARENVKRYLPENVMAQWENLFNNLTNKR